MKIVFAIVIMFMVTQSMNAQLSFEISTNKIEYEYGEPIFITCSLTNTADTTISILFLSYTTCQAKFKFDDYESWQWTTCLPLSEEVNISPNQSRIYFWEFDPAKFGYPREGITHKIVGSIECHLQPYLQSPIIELKDSIEISAPLYMGGQLNVSYKTENNSLVSELRDSLHAIVVDSSNLMFNGETWQFKDVSLDSMYNLLKSDTLFDYIEYNRSIAYDSIKTITDIEILDANPDEYYLGSAYPNPFNPSTKIKFAIPENSHVKISVYNILGQRVEVLVNTVQSTGFYETTWNACNLPSGIYLISIKAEGLNSKKSFVKIKKVLLLK